MLRHVVLRPDCQKLKWSAAKSCVCESKDSFVLCLILLGKKGIELWGGLVHTFAQGFLNFVGIFVSCHR
jgi:hypothetical protein